MRAAAAADLHVAEQLLLHALRAWGGARVLGRRPPCLVSPAFTAVTSARAAAFFAAWMQALEAGARRPIMLSSDGGDPSADEIRLIRACGVATIDLQVSCDLLEPLCREPEAVAVLGRGLNLSLIAAGWPYPARFGPGPGSALH